MPLSINNYCIENKEKDSENGDNTSKSNNNAIAINSTCHYSNGEQEAIKRSAIVVDFFEFD
jgi:hypothetical protein